VYNAVLVVVQLHDVVAARFRPGNEKTSGRMSSTPTVTTSSTVAGPDLGLEAHLALCEKC
jgi:hypothetical protein